MPSKPVSPRNVDLSRCVCDPSAEYRPERQEWVVRVSLEYPGHRPGNTQAVPPCFLPLFVMVSRRANGRLVAELESDQTDYTQPSSGWTIKRALLRGLRFWARTE